MKVSKFNNVYGETKAYKKYTGLKLSNTVPDSTLVKSNGKYLSCIWVSRGGGAFAILPMENDKNPKELNIKVPDIFPLFRGHKDHVLDVDFDPFDQQRCVSCSNDSDIYVWDIPTDFTIYGKLDEVNDFQTPVRVLSDHTKKVLQVLYHPIAKDILASTSMDKTVKIWNVSTGKVIYSIEHPDWVTSISFNYNGKYLATWCKDKKLRIYSFANEGEPKLFKTFSTHKSPKNAKCCFISTNEVVTCGFNGPERQFAVWNVEDQEDESEPKSGFANVDVSPSVMLPFADKSLSILLLAGKGDSTVKLYEKLDNGDLHELTDFTSQEPQKGFCIAPRLPTNTDVHKNELFRGYRTLNDKAIEEISFKCPLKTDRFQDEIYPDGPSFQSTFTAEEWINHKSRGDALPVVFQFKDVYEGNELIFSSATFKQETPKPSEKLTTTVEIEKGLTSLSLALPASPSKDDQNVVSTTLKHENVNDKKTDAPLKKVDEDLGNEATINKLLSKASSLDNINNAEDPSVDDVDNDNEWEVVESPKIKDAELMKKELQDSKVSNHLSESDKPEIKQEAPKLKNVNETEIKKDEKQELSKVEQTKVASSSEGKEINKKEEQESIKVKQPDTSLLAEKKEVSDIKEIPVKENKTMSLKQSVEKLSSLVLDLTMVVEGLKEANIGKDERIKELEIKIDQLIAATKN
ncbi:hypothetical protein QEN19_002445 [Hanseniaspora menglaensis]